MENLLLTQLNDNLRVKWFGREISTSATVTTQDVEGITSGHRDLMRPVGNSFNYTPEATWSFMVAHVLAHEEVYGEAYFKAFTFMKDRFLDTYKLAEKARRVIFNGFANSDKELVGKFRFEHAYSFYIRRDFKKGLKYGHIGIDSFDTHQNGNPELEHRIRSFMNTQSYIISFEVPKHD